MQEGARYKDISPNPPMKEGQGNSMLSHQKSNKFEEGTFSGKRLQSKLKYRIEDPTMKDMENKANMKGTERRERERL